METFDLTGAVEVCHVGILFQSVAFREYASTVVFVHVYFCISGIRRVSVGGGIVVNNNICFFLGLGFFRSLGFRRIVVDIVVIITLG